MIGRGTARRPGERGETLIEFAFASLIFFAMAFGALEFGIAVWNYNLISDLAQEGARYAAVHGQSTASSNTRGSTQAVAAYVASRAGGLGVTTTTPLGAPNTMTAGTAVEVLVSYPISVGGGVIPFWNFTIQSRASMIVSR